MDSRIGNEMSNEVEVLELGHRNIRIEIQLMSTQAYRSCIAGCLEVHRSSHWDI